MTVEAVGPVDCALHAGEVVGLVGLRGAGQETDRPRRSSAWSRSPAAAWCSTARRSPPRSPRQAMASGINLVCADRVGESVMPEPDRPREPLPQPAGRRARPLLATSRRAARTEASRELGRAGRPPAERSDAADRAPLRRQPAEGRRRPLAASRRQGLRLRGSDRRRRRRRQGGDLPPVRRRAAGGRGDRHRLDRFRGGRQGLPPRAGLRSRPRRGRARRRRSVGREPARRGLGQRRARMASRHIDRRRLAGAAMQSIKSNALEPTRSELAGLSRWRRSAACCRSTACRS